jgi:uncharacterized protein (TIGR02246 family)
MIFFVQLGVVLALLTLPLDAFSPHLNLSTSTSVMTPEAIQLVIQKAADSWVNGTVDAFARLFTLDGVFIIPGHRSVGFEEIRQTAKEFYDTHHQVEIKIVNILIEQEKAAVEWTWQDVNKITGKHSRADDVIMIDFCDNKICRWREYIDSAN